MPNPYEVQMEIAGLAAILRLALNRMVPGPLRIPQSFMFTLLENELL